jgi:sigma-E factor negative regulatory protein RseB
VGRVVEVDRVAGVGTRVRVRGSMDEPMVTADRGVPSVAPGDTGRMLGLLARNYAVARGPVERVAGRPAVVVEARRADGTVAARLWLDRSTGLVLRREVYDAAGRTVQSAGFLRLALDGDRPALDGDRLADSAGGSTEAASWTESVDPAALRSWRERGWACPEALPDGLTLVGARRGQADGVDVLQLFYSDGLTTLSLFQQRGRLDPDSLAGFRSADIAGVGAWTRPGAPAQVVWQAGDSVLTVVADAPSDLVASVVAALPGAAATPNGLMDRIARGWTRVVDAVTP